jgi:hypothetical protein
MSGARVVRLTVVNDEGGFSGRVNRDGAFCPGAPTTPSSPFGNRTGLAIN